MTTTRENAEEIADAINLLRKIEERLAEFSRLENDPTRTSPTIPGYLYGEMSGPPPSIDAIKQCRAILRADLQTQAEALRRRCHDLGVTL